MGLWSCDEVQTVDELDIVGSLELPGHVAGSDPALCHQKAHAVVTTSRAEGLQ